MRIQQLIKRFLDVLIATILLLLFSPLLLITTLTILIKEGRPIFYISKRCVAENREISVIKFRTMQHDAKSSKYNLNERFMRDGYLDIPLDCEVYTGIGKFLERSQIVEILQLVNVIFNGMSLVGNRPLPRENLALLRNFSNWQERFNSPAGMTGITQIVGKHHLNPEQRLGLEIQYSKAYHSDNILLCDLKILFYTAQVVFFGKNISQNHALKILKISSPT